MMQPERPWCQGTDTSYRRTMEALDAARTKPKRRAAPRSVEDLRNPNGYVLSDEAKTAILRVRQ